MSIGLKSILLIILCSVITAAKAQTVNDIAGVYRLRGAAHYVKPDGSFVVLGYATLITGTWELQEKGRVLFTPDYEKNRFTLYGRHNKNIGDSTRLMLSYGFYDDETLLHLGTLKQPVPEMKRIFRPGHRHISFPYVYTVKQKPGEVSFSYLMDDEHGAKSKTAEIYTFKNAEQYNDFIGFYWNVTSDNQPFTYWYHNGKMYADPESFSIKEDLNEVIKESEEELQHLINSFRAEYSPAKMYFTPLYNQYGVKDEDALKQDFIFNKNKNAYLHTYYQEGEEKSEDYDYNTIHILLEYLKMNDFSKQAGAIIIDEVPIFISPYDD